MSYPIIIVLITAIIVAGIVATAVQQHNERKEQQKRDEINKHKNILDETENATGLAVQMPVSQRLIFILKTRCIKALKGIYAQSPQPEIKDRINELTRTVKALEIDAEVPELDSFELPGSDKVIIKYIQAVKKLRLILRSEQNRGCISHKIFAEEDKQLERLQLRVNVETLHKRANEAVINQMQGSARQYLEKAIRALTAFKPQDEYTEEKIEELKKILLGLETSVKDSNLQQVLDKQRQESKELDELFAPKKKW